MSHIAFKNINPKKKSLIRSVFALAILASMSSCATVLSGRVTEYQRTKPAPGKPAREIRAVALIADVILFWPLYPPFFCPNYHSKNANPAPWPNMEN